MPMNLEEAGACRNKSRVAAALSEEQQAIADKDARFLDHIVNGEINAVQAMIRENQPVNVGDESADSAVHMAVRLSSDAILNLLVNQGAFVDYPNEYGKRPISIAMEMGDEHEAHTGMMETLLGLVDGAGKRIVDLAAVNPKTGNTLLHEAAWCGNAKAMGLLLKAMESHFSEAEFKIFLEQSNKQGQAAMHVAAFRSPKEVVMMLTEAGADPKVVEKNGRRLSKETPEDMALAMGREDTAEYLKSLNLGLNAALFATRMKKQKQAE